MTISALQNSFGYADKHRSYVYFTSTWVHVQPCLTLYNPMDWSLPDSSVHRVFQARTLKLAFPSPGDLPDPGIESGSLVSPALAGRFFTAEPPGKPFYSWGHRNQKGWLASPSTWLVQSCTGRKWMRMTTGTANGWSSPKHNLALFNCSLPLQRHATRLQTSCWSPVLVTLTYGRK